MKHDYDSGAYWKETLKLLRNVLILWFLVSFGAGILFVDFCTPGLHLLLCGADFLLRLAHEQPGHQV